MFPFQWSPSPYLDLHGTVLSGLGTLRRLLMAPLPKFPILKALLQVKLLLATGPCTWPSLSPQCSSACFDIVGDFSPCESFLNQSFLRDTFSDLPGWLILCVLSFLTIPVSGIISSISWLFFWLLFTLSFSPSTSLECKINERSDHCCLVHP